MVLSQEDVGSSPTPPTIDHFNQFVLMVDTLTDWVEYFMRETKPYYVDRKIDLPDEMWEKAIGIDRNGRRVNIDECELQPCCANISHIRDDLQEIREMGGCTLYQAEVLDWELENHGIEDVGENLREVIVEVLATIAQVDETYGTD